MAWQADAAKGSGVTMTTMNPTAFASQTVLTSMKLELDKDALARADAPIGVFDSGLGGLSVLAHLVNELPHERYVYLADTLHVPYGSRSSDDIRRLTIQAVDWLVNQGCKLVVIACNTASAHGLQAVRERYPSLPIVGLVPAIKPAVLRSQTKQIAVLATPATLHGELLNTVINHVAIPQGVQVHKYSLISLVPWVEAGMPTDHQAVHDLEQLLQQLFAHQVDQLVLGCTHYPFFKPYLQAKLATIGQDDVTSLSLIDSGHAIAKRVVSLLTQLNHLHEGREGQLTALQFYATANLATTTQVAQRLLHQFFPVLDVSFWQSNVTDK